MLCGGFGRFYFGCWHIFFFTFSFRLCIWMRVIKLLHSFCQRPHKFCYFEFNQIGELFCSAAAAASISSILQSFLNEFEFCIAWKCNCTFFFWRCIEHQHQRFWFELEILYTQKKGRKMSQIALMKTTLLFFNDSQMITTLWFVYCLWLLWTMKSQR